MPRIVSAPSSGRTYGDLARKVGADLGMPPDDDQGEILDAIYDVEADDSPSCFEVAIIAPRQNIKTSTYEIAALTDLFVFRLPLHVWTAHLFDTAQKTFQHMQMLIGQTPEYRELCRWPPRQANGDEAIELLTGEKIEFYARSNRVARGFADVARVTFDEALFLDAGTIGAAVPTMAVAENAQIRYGSSAGLADSEVLRGIRDRGHAGTPGLGYFEWYAERKACADKTCNHKYGHVTGCALDDEDLWAESNPALGRRITLKRMRNFREAMPAEEFAREFLGWWDEAGGTPAIPPRSWQQLADDTSGISGTPTFAVAVAADRSWAAIAGAGTRDDGLIFAECGRYGQTTSWVVPYVRQLAAERKVQLVVRTSSEAAALIPELEALRNVTVETVAGPEYGQACGDLHDSVVAKGDIRHGNQQPLNIAVRGAVWRQRGDVRTFDQRSSSTDISPLEAVTLALWGHRHRQNRPGRFLVV